MVVNIIYLMIPPREWPYILDQFCVLSFGVIANVIPQVIFKNYYTINIFPLLTKLNKAFNTFLHYKELAVVYIQMTTYFKYVFILISYQLYWYIWSVRMGVPTSFDCFFELFYNIIRSEHQKSPKGYLLKRGRYPKLTV